MHGIMTFRDRPVTLTPDSLDTFGFPESVSFVSDSLHGLNRSDRSFEEKASRLLATKFLVQSFL